ncbi:MAG: ATP-binding protein [Bradyrhizobium sp.]|nr:MAG: ATP-binding protein [Bradyrhizobium sp.]
MGQAFRIFISSPGDVADERRRAALVVSRLKREFARFFEISAVLWEYEPMLASGHFQDLIDPPGETDVVVLILWSRLGTPLPERTPTREYRGLDGRAPVTGTEWEFEQALDARAKHGAPDLLVYRKTAENVARFSRAEQLEQAKRQWDALSAFWTRYFEDEKGSFKLAFNPFDGIDAFETMLEAHLREVIRRRLPERPARAQSADKHVEWWSGSPYRGLQAFDVGHSAVFFGRERAVRDIAEALARRPAGFVVALGASGVGKSSLARAGVAPDLMTPGVVPGISQWRYAILEAGDLAPHPFAGLAAAILRPRALPELAALGYSPQEVVTLMRADPTLVVSQLRRALSVVDGSPTQESRVGLLLIVDQMETLFASPAVDGATRGAFDRLLAALIRSGTARALATMRSDFYPRLVELPELAALSRGEGQYQLAPPSAAELELIVRRPAESAGLTFEEDPRSGVGLDATIREAAARDPASLPLLSFVLDELYRRDVEQGGGNALTYAGYEALGRLEGAIARHADALVTALSRELKAALPRLLLALVEIDEVKQTVAARVALRAELAGAHERELADRLVAARLAVADVAADGETLRLAHEALLSRWPMLAGLIAEHRDFLAARRRLQRGAGDWQRNARHEDFLLPSGRQLAEAEELIANRRDELAPEAVAFAEASSARARALIEAAQRAKEAALRRELTRSRRVAAVVSLLLAGALAAGGYAWRQRTIASAALHDVEINYQAALDQAAGSVALLVNSNDSGALSTDLMRRLVEQARDTVTGLPGQSDAASAAQIKLLDAMSVAYLSLSGATTARQMAERANDLADQLHAKAPADADWTVLWLEARGRRADAKAALGDMEGALADARQGQAAALALAGPKPHAPPPPAGVDAVENQLAVADQRIGDLLRARGDFDGARFAYEDWRARSASLRAEQPTDTLWLRNDMFSIQRLGDLAMSSGSADGVQMASALFGDYLLLASEFSAARPQDAIGVEALFNAHERVGDAALAGGDADAAKREYLDMQRHAEGLIGFDAANFRWREDFAVASQRLGAARLAQADAMGALAEFQTYLSLSQALAAKDPDVAGAKYDVANAEEKVGDALRALGRLQEARQAYASDESVMATLSGDHPQNAIWRRGLSTSRQRLGLALAALGDSVNAKAAFRDCAKADLPSTIWSPRDLWPRDVTAYCRRESEGAQ